MDLRRVVVTAVFAACATAASKGFAQEKNCKLYPEGGLLKQSYDLIGPEACKAACTETNGCSAWSYTPHNFNPKSAPGECRLMEAVSEEAEDSRGFCGRL